MGKSKLLKKLYNLFSKNECCVFMDDEFLYVHHSLCTIYIDEKKKNEINISFEVNCDPTAAAFLTQKVIEFGNKHNYRTEIYEPYAYVLDDEDVIQQVLFGDEALEYFETGEMPEMPIKKVSKVHKKSSLEDLKSNLRTAVEKEEFEKASKLRDKIQKIENKKVKQ